MKVSVLLRLLAITLFLGLVCIETADAQTGAKKTYRRPSDNDIEWLLGKGDTKSTQTPRPPTCFSSCEVELEPLKGRCVLSKTLLKNPACNCEYCDATRPEAGSGRLEARGERSDAVATSEPIRHPDASVTQVAYRSGRTVLETDDEIIPAVSGRVSALVKTITTVSDTQPIDRLDGGVEPSAVKQAAPTPLPAPKKKAPAVLPPKTVPGPNRLEAGPEPETLAEIGASARSMRRSEQMPTNFDSESPFPAACDNILSEKMPCEKVGREKVFHERPPVNCGKTCACRVCCDWRVPDMIGDASSLSGQYAEIYYGNTATTIRAIPTTLLSRLNIAEHFNAETTDRIWFDYRHLNNASTYQIADPNGSRGHSMAVDQFTLGVEKRFLPSASVELRVPFLHQLDSSTALSRFGETGLEIGNIAVVFKYLFAQNEKMSFSGGVGMTIPTAENWRIAEANAMLRNKSYNIVPYLGLQWHPDTNNFGHALLQVDIPVSDNEFQFGRDVVEIDSPPAVRLGIQLGRWFYRNEAGTHSCRMGGFLELDYTVVTNNFSRQQLAFGSNYIGIASQEVRPQTLNLVAGVPILFGHLSVSNAVIVPLTSNGRQFSVAYNVSVVRRF